MEIGDAQEYGSFERFQDRMLRARVKESVDGCIRTVDYRRSGRRMEMDWHCYLERYLKRRIDGKDVEPIRFLQSPEFAVGDSGHLETHDAKLTTRKGEPAWLLSAAPSQSWVAYQTQPHVHLPLILETPVGEVESERFPFGKLVVQQRAEFLHLEIDTGFRPFWSSVKWRAQIWQGMGIHPSDIVIRTRAPKVTAFINGDAMPVIWDDANEHWLLDPYARIPRVLDRLQPAGRPPVTVEP